MAAFQPARVLAPYYSSPSAKLLESVCQKTPVLLPSGLESSFRESL